MSTLLSKEARLKALVGAFQRSGMTPSSLAKRVGAHTPAHLKSTSFIPPPPAKIKNPTLVGANHLKRSYRAVPEHLRKALEGTPLVKAGVPPHMAYQLSYMSRKQGEGALDSLVRHAVTPMQATLRPPAAAAAATAGAVPRNMGSMVTKLSYWQPFYEELYRILEAGS